MHGFGENVPGLLTANSGDDWRHIIRELNDLGYATNHTIINADAFVPQSRARVFLVGYQGDEFAMPDPPPAQDELRLADLADPQGDWWPSSKLVEFLGSLSDIQKTRVTTYQRRFEPGFFGTFRRTRKGKPVWEVRSDEKVYALRTTRGGSARQAILKAGDGALAAHWMTFLEYARLQGAKDFKFDAVTPAQAMFALGDAVCVPAVEWLSRQALHLMLKQ